MERSIRFGVPTLLAASLLTLFAGVPRAMADEMNQPCTLATLHGPYTEVLTGTIIGLGPVAQVGVTTYDGAGNVVSDATDNVNGNAFPEHQTGTYTVNANCTGSSQIGVASRPPHRANFVILGRGKEVNLLVLDHGVVITIDQKRQFSSTEEDRD